MNLFKSEPVSALEHVNLLCESNEVVKAWLHENARKTYPNKTNCVGNDNGERYRQAIKGDDVLRRIEAVYLCTQRPLAEVTYANLGRIALPAPGIEWVLGPDFGTRILQQMGRVVYNFLYESAGHFEGVSDHTMFIAAHKFCDKHEENFVQWIDRKTGRNCFYANTGAYFEVTDPMAFNHLEYIPPIHGCYGFEDAVDD